MQDEAADEATSVAADKTAREAILNRARQRQQQAHISVDEPAELDLPLKQRARRHAKWRVRQAMGVMPGPVRKRLTKRRHLDHVAINMGHLTPPALLGAEGSPAIGWIRPEGLPETPPPEALDWEPLSEAGAVLTRGWLDAGTYDDDAMLDRRMDGQGDELGRARSAVRVRLALAETASSGPIRATENEPTGMRILVDARSLQSAAFGTRGIGRFASAAVLALREETGDHSVDLLVDLALEDLPASIAGECRQVTRIDDPRAYGYLLQPSPMTASPEPLIPILTGDAHKVAIVFDYIPLHLPDVYVPHVSARLEYAAALDALRCYDEFVCISHLVKDETSRLLNRRIDVTVAWPAAVLPSDAQPRASTDRSDGPIVLMTGDDARKNTFGGLAGIGAATSNDQTRDVVVLGMAGQGVRVHHWSIAAMMRPGECTTAERIPDAEMAELLARASLVVVPSFDEGLSLPVIEAALAGAPVVASDIPSHRELIGTGSYLADPRSPQSLERAITRHRARALTATQQRHRLSGHQHAHLEDVIAASVRAQHRPQPIPLEVVHAAPPATVNVAGRALRVGVATPWSPQKSGVADYSVATISALAEIADVTVYTTSDARVADAIRSRPVQEAVSSTDDHDVFLSVLGNSHFHLPHLDLLERIDTVAINHDTRMIEYYMALRGRGGVSNLMLRGTGRRELHPDLDEQVNDMRLLQSAGFWEIARRARILATHSPCSAPTISQQTGRPVEVLPFANYRRPSIDRVTEPMRAQARRNLGMWDDTVHLASFGYIDTRTKLTDLVVESAAWLQQWGRRVHLHLVGSASPEVEEDLVARAKAAGLTGFTITGFAPEAMFRDYLVAIDLGIQLRVSSLLGVSGPLSDMAAYGTPAIASYGLATDVDTPDFIERLPDDVSPVMVAEAIEHALSHPRSLEEREEMRVTYLDEKSPARYADQLLTLLQRGTEAGSA